MSKITIREWYGRVNATWPAGPLPIPTEREAAAAARRLYRYALGKTWTGSVEITSGRRYTWVRRGVLVVNPNRQEHQGSGWVSLVHDLSHMFHHRLSSERPHGGTHARLEIRLIKQVLKRGWLHGALRAHVVLAEPAPQADPRIAKLRNIEAKTKRWTTKLKRAQTALKKLARQERYYRRVLSA